MDVLVRGVLPADKGPSATKTNDYICVASDN